MEISSAVDLVQSIVLFLHTAAICIILAILARKG